MQAVFSTLTPFLEVLILAVLLDYILSFFWNTRSKDLVLGVLAFLGLFGISSWMNLPILHKMMTHIGSVAMIAILILFQPELRVALSKFKLQRRRPEVLEFDVFLDQLAGAVYRMSSKSVGALIVLQNKDSLDELPGKKTVYLNATFSPELLESIFTPLAPLHDGAVIIRDRVIVAAAVILPLSGDSSQLSRAMGTRHLAGLGTSQNTDAIVIIISEHSGKVSIARDGVMTPEVKVDRFKGILRSVFTASEKELTTRLSLREWWAQ